MFSGIVKGLFSVTSLEISSDLLNFSIKVSPEFKEGLEIGASVAVDGVCLTVVVIDGCALSFDVIAETLKKTTLKDLHVGRTVGCERSMKVGDEIGGHCMSGHVWGVAMIHQIEHNVLTISCPEKWMKYILPKGFIAIDGASLTVVDVSEEGFFTVHLIPETLARTPLGSKKAGNFVNIEIENQTQAVVDTVNRFLSNYGLERTNQL